ncbi:CRS2-associated factor 2 [Populus alba x Populus x berolinensis]|nr:CRS2-associated factor 2 [Populus alba x Populus x berolinensis]
MPGPYPFGKFPEEGKSREEILGEPLKTWEIKMLIKPHLSDNRQLVHSHWKRRRVSKVRCKGFSTVEMDNVCRHVEEKTGVKDHPPSWWRSLSFFRGRNYNYRTLLPQYPVIASGKPAAPVFGPVVCCLGLFDDEQILMWSGQILQGSDDSGKSDDDCDNSDAKIVSSSPKMMLLWKHALESNKAILLDEIDLGPDALLRKVEEFEGISQATEHSYPALVMSSEDGSSNSISTFEDDSHSEIFSKDDMYSDDEYYDSESFEELETSAAPGSLSIDLIAEKLDKK